MPVHPKFAYPGEESAQAARRALGLDPEKFTVFVNAGWEGGGNIPQIFRELVRGELEVQAIFLAGRNEELRADAESLAKSASFPPGTGLGGPRDGNASEAVERAWACANTSSRSIFATGAATSITS
jgi:hypothetical protein